MGLAPNYCFLHQINYWLFMSSSFKIFKEWAVELQTQHGAVIPTAAPVASHWQLWGSGENLISSHSALLRKRDSGWICKVHLDRRLHHHLQRCVSLIQLYHHHFLIQNPLTLQPPHPPHTQFPNPSTRVGKGTYDCNNSNNCDSFVLRIIRPTERKSTQSDLWFNLEIKNKTQKGLELVKTHFQRLTYYTLGTGHRPLLDYWLLLSTAGY